MLLNPWRFSVGGGDPYWANVVALLHWDGTDGSTTFVDQKGHTFTGAGGAALSTAQKKFGTASLLLNGTGSSVSSPTSADWDMGGGDFTIECSVRPAVAVSTRMEICSRWATNGISLAILDTGFLRAVVSSTGLGNVFVGPGATTVTHNVWHHVALVRAGGTLRLFLDGVSQGTAAFSGSIAPITMDLAVGSETGTTRFFNGNIDEFRMTKGIARYTGDFTPDTAAFLNS